MTKTHQSISKNSPCPCGSGKKYKRCCGSENVVASRENGISISLARQLLKSGNPKLADEVCRRLIDENKSIFEALCLRGDISANLRDSISYYQRAAEINPKDVSVNSGLGRLYMAARRFDDAVESYQRCVDISSGAAEHQIALGAALAAAGHYNNAIRIFETLISSGVRKLSLFVSAANVMSVVGDFKTASVYLEKASALSPSDYEVLCSSAFLLFRKGDLDLAEREFEELLLKYPTDLFLLKNVEEMYTAIGRYDRSLELLEVQYALATGNQNQITRRKAFVFARQGRLNEALELLRSARTDENSALMNCWMGMCCYIFGLVTDAVAYYKEAIAAGLRDFGIESVVSYLSLYDPSNDEDELTVSAKSNAEELLPAERQIDDNRIAADIPDVIRIGFVSADLNRHSVSYFMLPVFEEIDRDRFEIYVYDNSLKGDEVKDRFVASADYWRYIKDLSDEAARSLILDDRIDVLFDLSGFTTGHRLGVFALRAAPVQVSWLGCPSTTGLQTMDYRLTDEISDPVGMTERYYTERLWRMPKVLAAYSPDPGMPPISDLPALKRGFITFGSFNNLDKLNVNVVALWTKLLREIPESRLVLKTKALSNADVREQVISMFSTARADSSRLMLLGADQRLSDHYTRYADIDIALDSFPYNGTTTNCDALWMGVPVITMVGAMHRQRVTFSQLSAIGLAEFGAHSEAEFIEIAKRLSRDLTYLSMLRSGMRDRLKDSPLMNGRLFIGDFEEAIWGMYKEVCQTRG